MKKEIEELVTKALNSNTFACLKIGVVDRKQGTVLKKLIGDDLTGCERYIDVYGIKHSLGSHVSINKEKKRGQVAINLDDFTLVPEILKSPDKIEYIGKNRLRQDMIKYSKKIGSLYVVVEAVRVRKSGNRLFFQTMYKKK